MITLAKVSPSAFKKIRQLITEPKLITHYELSSMERVIKNKIEMTALAVRKQQIEEKGIKEGADARIKGLGICPVSKILSTGYITVKGLKKSKNINPRDVIEVITYANKAQRAK